MKKITVLLLGIVLLMTACQFYESKQDMNDNPFFSEWTTPYGVPPFDKITEEHFIPAFEMGIENQNLEIDAIVSNPDSPTFENTIEALDRSGSDLRKVGGVFFNLTDANTNEKITDINAQVAPILANHKDNIMLNANLFARVKSVYDQQKDLNLEIEIGNAAALNQEQKALLDDTYREFVRGGSELVADDQAKLREINEKLASLYPKFGDILLKESNNYYMLIEDEKELAGLPKSVKDGAAEIAIEKGHEGAWAFTLDKPSWIPFLQYADNRDRRKELYTVWMNRGKSEEYNTTPVINEILVLREQKAKLLGYNNFAEYAIDKNMAKTPDRVYNLLMGLWNPALEKAKKEAADLKAIMNKEGVPGELNSWDWWYYTEKVRKEKFDLDENELRPYFSIDQVKKGAFELATRLYGIQFIKRTDLPVYHEDGETYEILEADGSHVGIFYVDYFPRASKRGGAWMEAYRKQSGSGDDKVTPIIVNVGNFTKPTADAPSLLSIDEVLTLFHELGHGLHGFLSNVEYQSISGTSVKRDFVELPSQIMENWALEPELLKLYAHHYETGDTIPLVLVEKIQKSGQFNQGFVTAEYLAASFLDMDYHTAPDASAIDIEIFEKESMDKIGLIDAIIPRYRSNYFNHSFGGEGYAAGYYVYIWAAVLDTDAYDAFVEQGIFNRELGQSFRDNIISRGGSDDPMTLYVNFRGAEPSIQPLLKKRGLN
ncbi:MAG: M3 family metallopeptidase [Bacteroidetes bacterium]|nr:M3 family metallopeptidase [Bacteroidota bacterium]MBL6942844.1 M3 family metallopeptidase [Bacteroidales bacterium]